MRILNCLVLWLIVLSTIHCRVAYIFSFIQNGAVLPRNQTETMGASDSFSGKLSTVGMRQLYNLGSRLKEKYIIEQGLGFEWFDYRHSQFNVSDEHASEEAAISFIYGFYPLRTGLEIFKTVKPKYLAPPYQTTVHRNLKVEERRGFALIEGFQPVPLHPIFERKLDDRTKDSVSPLTKDEKGNISIWFRAHLNSLRRLKKRLGMIEKSNEDVLNEYEVIQEELYFGKSLPTHFTQNDFQQLKYLFKSYQAHRNSQPSALSAINVTISDLKSRFELTSQGKSKLTMNFIFQSHKDVWPILLFFNLTSPTCIDDQYHSRHVSSLNCVDEPSFSSSLIFELHEENGKKSIMALYNGVYVNLCEKRSHRCDLDDFLSRLQPNIKKQALDNTQKVSRKITKTDE